MIGFVWPWIFLILPLPLFLKQWFSTTHNSVTAINVPPSVSDALGKAQDSHKNRVVSRWFRLALPAVAWCGLLTSIAQPYIPQPTIAQPVSGRALALLIDLSTSMERKDFKVAGDTVDRLTVVKKIASQFIANRTGDRIGLVLFGSEAFIASPPSYDLNAVNSILQSSGIGMAGRTTAMGDALGLAIKSLRDDPALEKAIVLLSDGTSNAGSVEPEDAATLASSLGITVHTIGLGSEAVNDQQQFQSASADLDEATLKSIADVSGGKFFRAHTTDELEQIYNEIDTIELAESLAPPLIIKRDLRNLFVLLTLLSLAPLLLSGIRKGQYA